MNLDSKGGFTVARIWAVIQIVAVIVVVAVIVYVLVKGIPFIRHVDELD